MSTPQEHIDDLFKLLRQMKNELLTMQREKHIKDGAIFTKATDLEIGIKDFEKTFGQYVDFDKAEQFEDILRKQKKEAKK